MLGWELPPHNSGGLGVACYQLCRALNSNGVDIEFILPYEADHKVDFMKIHSAVSENVSTITRFDGAYDSYKYIMKDGTIEWHDIFSQQLMYESAVEKIADRLEFDVIHAHDWLTFRAALRAKSIKNRPVILHIHSIEHDRAGGKYGNPLVHEIEYNSMLMADKIIAVSRHTKNMIVSEYGIPADKIDVIHNSLDISNFQTVDSENSFNYLSELKGQGYKIVTNVGRLTVQKGLFNLLKAAQKVIHFQPKTIFLVVGSGEQYYELISLAAELGISKNIFFTGFLRGKKWRDAFDISDLFIMPSVSEPFGLTPLEAAGYKTPSLVSKQSGVSEVFKNCLKVDYWDIDKMTDAIVGVLKNPSLQTELSENAFKEFLTLSWDNAATRLRNHYETHTEKALL